MCDGWPHLTGSAYIAELRPRRQRDHPKITVDVEGRILELKTRSQQGDALNGFA